MGLQNLTFMGRTMLALIIEWTVVMARARVLFMLTYHTDYMGMVNMIDTKSAVSVLVNGIEQ